MFMHTSQDDNILGTMRFVSKFEDFQIFGVVLPNMMTNQQIRDSDAYKTCLAYATGTVSLEKNNQEKDKNKAKNGQNRVRNGKV
ncbi:hypothetical protein Tco_1411975 [Tanacetum coccineum]